MVLVIREKKRPFRPDPLCAHRFASSAVAPWESEISGNVKHRPFRLYDRPLPRAPGNTVTSPHPPLFMCRRLWGDIGPPDCIVGSEGSGGRVESWIRVSWRGCRLAVLGSVERLCAPANGSLALAVVTASRPSQSCPSVRPRQWLTPRLERTQGWFAR